MQISSRDCDSATRLRVNCYLSPFFVLRAPHHRINSTGALQDLSISLVVEPSTKARMREWP